MNVIVYRNDEGVIQYISEYDLTTERYREFMGADYNPRTEAAQFYGDSFVGYTDVFHAQLWGATPAAAQSSEQG